MGALNSFSLVYIIGEDIVLTLAPIKQYIWTFLVQLTQCSVILISEYWVNLKASLNKIDLYSSFANCDKSESAYNGWQS